MEKDSEPCAAMQELQERKKIKKKEKKKKKRPDSEAEAQAPAEQGESSDEAGPAPATQTDRQTSPGLNKPDRSEEQIQDGGSSEAVGLVKGSKPAKLEKGSWSEGKANGVLEDKKAEDAAALQEIKKSREGHQAEQRGAEGKLQGLGHAQQAAVAQPTEAVGSDNAAPIEGRSCTILQRHDRHLS